MHGEGGEGGWEGEKEGVVVVLLGLGSWCGRGKDVAVRADGGEGLLAEDLDVAF